MGRLPYPNSWGAAVRPEDAAKLSLSGRSQGATPLPRRGWMAYLTGPPADSLSSLGMVGRREQFHSVSIRGGRREPSKALMIDAPGAFLPRMT